MSRANAELVELGDLDELVRHVERLAGAGAWDELVDLRVRCRAALERGRQLWAIASLAEYRLALEAPAAWAASVLAPGTGRFAPGPLPEVAASTHSWQELAPHVIPLQVEASVAAFERVVHGEDLRDDERVDQRLFDVPLRLLPWEPRYPLARYEADGATFPLPVVTGFERCTAQPGAERVDDPEAVRALVELAGTWTTESNGRAEAVTVRGDAPAAIGALGVRTCRVAELSPADALARMAWTAASGGAHGRRPGMAAGRFAAWWAAAALAALLDSWPVDPDELGEAVEDLHWYAWDPGGPDVGWSCRLAAEDAEAGLAWALSATDAA